MKRVILSIIIVLICVSTASAAYSLNTCSSSYYCRGATARISCGENQVNYTVKQINNSMTFQFKDISRGKETYIRWDFGDGTYLEGTKITKALKNPTHKFPRKAWDTHYTGCLTIKCQGVKGKLWIHKDLKIKVNENDKKRYCEYLQIQNSD
jgi:hypothetical protein